MRAVIQWFNGHSQLQMLLQEHQTGIGIPVKLIRACQTRWTSHHSASKRMLRLAPIIETLVITKREEMLESLSPDKGVQSTALKILGILRNPGYWRNLEVFTRLIEPLAVTALTLQADSTRLDHVLLSFGRLFTQYRSWATDASLESAEYEATTAVLRSLEKRWKESDQDIFICAVILNPFIGRTRLCFNSSILSWQRNGLYQTLKRVYSRIFRVSIADVPESLFQEWQDYKRSAGQFDDESLAIHEYRRVAVKEKRSPDPVQLWEVFESDVDHFSSLRRLALRLYRIIPNTAAIERLFSAFSLIDTDRRSKLHFQATASTALFRAHVQKKHQNQRINYEQDLDQAEENALHGTRKRKIGTNQYVGDVALSTTRVLQTTLDPADLGLEDEPLGTSFGDDWELANRRWFQDIMNELDDESSLAEEDTHFSSSPITLQELFDAQSTLSFQTHSPFAWKSGSDALEEEMAFFESVANPDHGTSQASGPGSKRQKTQTNKVGREGSGKESSRRESSQRRGKMDSRLGTSDVGTSVMGTSKAGSCGGKNSGGKSSGAGSSGGGKSSGVGSSGVGSSGVMGSEKGVSGVESSARENSRLGGSGAEDLSMWGARMGQKSGEKDSETDNYVASDNSGGDSEEDLHY